MKNGKADFLFATPSAISGVARFFDFAGAYDVYNASQNEAEADAKAAFMDWLCVGDALHHGLSTALLDAKSEPTK